jgi:hypothetical protein
MFDYMRTKNGNIIAVVDKKKSLSCSTKTIPKGSSVRRFQRKKFVCGKSKKSVGKGKMNYVVMETGNTWMIKLL